MPDIEQLTEAEHHRQYLSQLIHDELKGKEGDALSLLQIRTGIDCLLDKSHLQKIFKEDGHVKTRWLTAHSAWMHDVVNPVTSDFKCGKINTQEQLGQQQQEVIDRIKDKVVRQNYLMGKRKNEKDSDMDGAKQLALVKAAIEEAFYTDDLTPSQEILAKAWQECRKDMNLVDRWAYGVWQKHGVMFPTQNPAQ